MPYQILNIKKLLINFNKSKKKRIKNKNSELIHFKQEHNHRFKH